MCDTCMLSDLLIPRLLSVLLLTRPPLGIEHMLDDRRPLRNELIRSSLGDWLNAAFERKLPAVDWLCEEVLELERNLDRSAAVNASQADWTRRRCISLSC